MLNSKGVCMGGTLIFSRRLRPFGGGVKTLNFNIFGGFQKKMNIFAGMKILWIFLGVITNSTIFRGHFYAFKGLSLRSRYRMGVFIWAAFQIVLGVLEIPDIFFG